MNACFSVLLTTMTLSSMALSTETKIARNDLPVPVQKAVEEQSKGAVIRGFTKEIENGKTEYEAELTVDGHSKDISFDAAGNVVAIEEEVKLESVPPAARAAIRKAAQGGTVRKVESVTEGGKSLFEATIRKGCESFEVRLDKDGTKIK